LKLVGEDSLRGGRALGRVIRLLIINGPAILKISPESELEEAVFDPGSIFEAFNTRKRPHLIVVLCWDQKTRKLCSKMSVEVISQRPQDCLPSIGLVVPIYL
jgi:hypothetical protein